MRDKYRFYLNEYPMFGISKYLDKVQSDFEVFGLLNDTWIQFDKEIEFEAFVVKRKIK